MVTDGAEQGAAELIGKQLDFLNKELLRLQVSVTDEISSIIILYCVNCKFSILSAPPCGNHMLLPQCTVHCNTVY